MKANPLIVDFMEQEDNKLCFDCGGKPANWVSVNNSIFLCLNCSGNHRGLGVNVSYIKSIVLDKWNENQTKMLLSGGNARLADLLESFEVPAETEFKVLYTSQLLNFYRKLVSFSI